MKSIKKERIRKEVEFVYLCKSEKGSFKRKGMEKNKPSKINELKKNTDYHKL